MQRSRTLPGLAFAALAFLMALQAPGATVATPAVTGPITGGTHGRPFTSSIADLKTQGYVEEEYFLEGSAATYGSAQPLTVDGLWAVTQTGSQPYKTRLLVRRPADPKRFNGTVLVEWLNVSGGFDVDAVWGYTYDEMMREGFAWVGVSTQRAGIEPPPLRPGFSQPMKIWDVARYGSLHIANDDTSYDIFSQGAQAVGPHRPKLANDPMGGLPVQRLIGIGQSQSANRLATYVDAVHPLARVLDGFLIASRIGKSGGAAPLAADLPLPDAVKIRNDLATPILVMETESDAVSHYPARTPDSDHFRLWEIAGTTHQNAWADRYFGAEIKRDLGTSGMGGCDNPVNAMPTEDVADAALHHVNLWVKDGKAPPTAPRILMLGSPGVVQRDDSGNAMGGIRLPDLAAPTAKYGGVGTPDACRLEGFMISFSPAALHALYPSHAAYLARFKQAVSAAERAGYILPPEAARELRAASGNAIGK